ncbi:MFS transporter [Paenibacillus chitinolyticus]|uniref:MFS transporter n=1 Tax=Paenibacillus chitinolyticus TaxID=79263 RepID=A0A410WXS2_9BACL|nr:MFS transporter [Paenibacillus chitinolyticus]MCY9589743.1 MFS transporter [Paenibacillus chitinolyticus]MCY9598256.1 MFS transporter [Paenibacillus chitinolyticus]QAV19120.1 MFS transporter [Paenibacillus chitinolyticus]
MFKTWKIYMLALISFLVGTSEYIIAGILDKISASLDISLVAAGQLITVFSLVYGLGTPFLIAWTARWERRKLLIYSLGLFVVANLLAFILPGFAAFVGARVLMALGAGVVVVTALTVAAKIAPSGKQASAIATVITGFTASLIVGVPLGRLVAATYDWKTIFAGIGALGLLAMFILSVTIPKTEGDAPVPLREQMALLKQPRILLALSVSFFWLGGYSIAYTYISPYLLTITGMNEKMLSAALLAFGIASLVGSKFGGYSADKWGVYRTLMSGMTLHIITLLLLTLAAHSPVVVFAVLILWSFAAWSSGPTQQYNLVTMAPESSGIMLSLNSSVMQLAMAAGAGIGGIIVGSISLNAVTWIGAAGVAAAIVINFVSFKLSAAERHKPEREHPVRLNA